MISESVIGSVYHCITIPYKHCGGGWWRGKKHLFVYGMMHIKGRFRLGVWVLVFILGTKKDIYCIEEWAFSSICLL